MSGHLSSSLHLSHSSMFYFVSDVRCCSPSTVPHCDFILTLSKLGATSLPTCEPSTTSCGRVPGPPACGALAPGIRSQSNSQHAGGGGGHDSSLQAFPAVWRVTPPGPAPVLCKFTQKLLSHPQRPPHLFPPLQVQTRTLTFPSPDR